MHTIVLLSILGLNLFAKYKRVIMTLPRFDNTAALPCGLQNCRIRPAPLVSWPSVVRWDGSRCVLYGLLIRFMGCIELHNISAELFFTSTSLAIGCQSRPRNDRKPCPAGVKLYPLIQKLCVESSWLNSDRNLNVSRQLSLQLLVARDPALHQVVRCHGAARHVWRDRTYDIAELKLLLLDHMHQDALTEVNRPKSVGKRSCLHRLAAFWTYAQRLSSQKCTEK